MAVSRWLLAGLLVFGVSGSDIISRSRIVQSIPPKAKFGLNPDAFEKVSGLFCNFQ
jgi:hypothetical protein